ncbi:MAG: hypothetical protein ACXVPN_14170 [Bacteroidia bacterium]
MKFLYVIVCCLLLAGLTSCNKHHNEAPPDLGYDYYPAKLHSYIVYDVDSFSYSPQKDSVKYYFQIKEKFDSIFTDNSGRTTYKIIRYKKMLDSIPYSAKPWILQDVWMANVTKTDVEVVEENIRYTKLPFPVKQNAKWNGTAHADTVECDYSVTEFDVSSSYNGLSFPKTLTVNQAYSSTLINYQNHNERYARGVGLIYKEISYYSYQNGSVLTPGHRYEGLHYTMTINSFGVE